MAAKPPRSQRAEPTILDVARRAAVSKSTVSNVIRGVSNVSPETRKRVLDAVAEIGYRPNALARDLVRRRTSTLGLVVGDLANPFYSELAKLVEQHASASGYGVMICNTDGRPESEQRRIGLLLEQRVAGIVMLQFSGDTDVLAAVLRRGVPVVVVSCYEETADCVAVDDERGAELAVAHLLELGHRRIAYVSSATVEPNTDDARRGGYERTLRRAGVEPSPELVLELAPPPWVENDEENPARLAAFLDGDDGPTALFVSNDLVAIEAIDALDGLGVRVPDDVSVVGFDDIAMAGLARLSLTTVAQPRDALARIGAELLVERMESGEDGPPRQVRLDPTLVRRRSTAAPRAPR
jgi:LacI family transcriptional regulator